MIAIRAIFFEECAEQLSELESGLLAMQAGALDSETVNAVFRAVHSVKGGAGAFALDELVRFAHVFETTLDDLRSGRSTANEPLLKLMLQAADVLADLVGAARDSSATDGQRAAQTAQALTEFGRASAAPTEPTAAVATREPDEFGFTPVLAFASVALLAAPEPSSFIVVFRPGRELYAKGNEATLLMRELSRLGETEVSLDAGALPGLAELDPEEAYLTWTARVSGEACDEAKIREVFDFVDDNCELSVASDLPAPASTEPEIDVAAILSAALGAPAPAPPVVTPPVVTPEPALAPQAPEPPVKAPESAAKPDASASAAPAPTIRVDLDRVDRLINLVGELVINSAMLSQRIAEAGISRKAGVALGLDELEQLTREIQDSVMAIRAQPVKSVFQRMPRLVREIAEHTGKQVRLVTEGESTEVDKTIIERLSDPLTHMIRNAIDHGIESPSRRQEAGKPVEGVVRLSALHRSGRIVIEVADDGAGINRERVRAIAVERGLVAPDAALSDDEVDNLIFLPGFSTASTVSDISGRGVGMDVVKRSIQALGGRISISSTQGHGSMFTLSLPLTLAVLDGMVVTVAGQTLVAPLTAIVETLQPKRSQVHGLGENAQLVSVRDSYVPLVDVGVRLGFRDHSINPSEGVALLVESEGGVRTALLVDAIQGQRQVVIKSLEANYRRVPGIAAATILGDGRVALILDIDAVAAFSRDAPVERSVRAPKLQLATAG